MPTRGVRAALVTAPLPWEALLQPPLLAARKGHLGGVEVLLRALPVPPVSALPVLGYPLPPPLLGVGRAAQHKRTGSVPEPWTHSLIPALQLAYHFQVVEHGAWG